MRLGGMGLAALATLAMATTARADDLAKAKALASEGTALARASKFEAAIAKFKEAESFAPSAGNDCNIGLAYLRLGRWHQAELFISRCKRRWASGRSKPLPGWLAAAEARLQKELTAGGYAPVRLTTEPETAEVSASALEADEWVASPATIHLPPGVHTVMARLAGHTSASRSLEVRQPDPIDVALSLTAEKPVVLETTPSTKNKTEPGGPEPDEPSGAKTDRIDGADAPIVTHGTSRPARSRLPWVVGGASVAIGVGGAVAHILTAGKRTEAADTRVGEGYSGKLRTFKRYRAVTVSLYATAAAGVALAYALSRLGKPSDGPALEGSVGANGASVGLRWTID